MKNKTKLMEITNTKNIKYILLNNGKLFIDNQKNSLIIISRRLVLQLEQLFKKNKDFFNQNNNYLKGFDGLYKFKYFNEDSIIVIKHQGSFEAEQPIKTLLSYLQ